MTSGTATLETALLGVPQVVVYKGTSFSYQVARRLIKVSYISLVNLIVDKLLIPELIQSECTPENIEHHLHQMLKPERAEIVRAGYHELMHQLTSGGGAEAAALDIISDINSRE